MTYDDYEPLINRLIALFPQRPILPATIAAYWEMLSDIDAETFALAVRECAVTCDWFPTVKQLRTAAEDVILATIPDSMDKMRRFPHRIKDPGMRAIVEFGSDRDSRLDLPSEDDRSRGLPEHARRLSAGMGTAD